MPDVTPASPTPASTKRKRRYLPPDELRSLFLLFGRYRALTVPHAHALLVAAGVAEPGYTLRSTQRRVAKLIEEGYLNTFSISARPPVRFIFVTRSVFDRWPELHAFIADGARKRPVADVAVHAWTRAALAAAAAADGFTVGSDLKALTALRRFLIDAQEARVAQAQSAAERDELARTLASLRALTVLQPWFVSVCNGCALELPVNAPAPASCEECGSAFKQIVVATPYGCGRCGLQAERTGSHTVAGVACSGTLRAVDYLPFDLAWRRGPHGYEVKVLFADNPYRSLQAQLAELPLRVIGQPQVPVVLRAPDDGSLFDRAARAYALRGPRLRALQRAFSESARADAFPFWSTAAVAPDALFPEAHFRVLNTSKENQ